MRLGRSLRKTFVIDSTRPVMSMDDTVGYSAYVSAKDVGMLPALPSEFVRFAETLDASIAIHELARLNVAIQVENHDHRDLQREIAENYLAPSLLAQIQGTLNQQPGSRVWISTFQLRSLIAIVLAHGARFGGNSLEDPSVRHRLGELFLSSGNTFAPHTGQFAGSDPLWWVERHIDISKAGYVSDTRYIDDMAIKGQILTKLLSKLGIDQDFERRYGFSPIQYQTALTGVWTHAANLGYAHAGQIGPVTLGFEYMMGQLGVNQRVGEQLLSEFVFDLDIPVPDASCAWRPDFAGLADRPLVKHGNSYVCIDLAFMRNRVTRSLWNLALKVAKDSGKRHCMEGEAGDLFGDYCLNLLQICEAERKPQGMWLAPMTELQSKVKGEANVDAFMSDGSFAAIFEFKSAPLPTVPLFGSDPLMLAESINSKLIYGNPAKSEKLGFSQLAHRLERVFAEPDKFHLGPTTRVVPCLVSGESAVSAAPLYTYIQKEASKLFERYGARVTRPVVLHPEDLGLLAMRSKTSITYMLQKLSEVEIVFYGTTRNAILKLWPHETLEKMHRLVEIERPTDFLDQAIKYLESNSVRAPTQACPRCNNERRFTVGFDSINRWWCTSCRQGTIASQEDARDQARHRETILAAYRSS